jgi:Ser/Thr protein kinase RdoA (MazF antagonist)
MPKGRAHFSSSELAVVLSHYDIGIIRRIRSLGAGNPHAPKAVVASDRGVYLVKRRPRNGCGESARVRLAHSIRQFLAVGGYPVPRAVHTRDGDSVFLNDRDHVYEVFEYVSGRRYDGSAEETEDAGRWLAEFHVRLARFTSEYKPTSRGFHDSEAVRSRLRLLQTARDRDDSAPLQETACSLLSIYNTAAEQADGGLAQWPEEFAHGDWHPGNIMFDHGRVSAILDLDSVRLAPRPTDLANGLLQFSIIGGKGRPAAWPDSIDLARLAAFMRGYRQVGDTTGCADILPGLMVETMVAEAVLLVAATGSFGGMADEDFLAMILRKCRWLEGNRAAVAAALTS